MGRSVGYSKPSGETVSRSVQRTFTGVPPEEIDSEKLFSQEQLDWLREIDEEWFTDGAGI
jgi:hypothetical protein